MHGGKRQNSGRKPSQDGVQPATAWRPKTPAIRAKYDTLGGSRWLNEHLAALVQQDADTMAKK